MAIDRLFSPVLSKKPVAVRLGVFLIVLVWLWLPFLLVSYLIINPKNNSLYGIFSLSTLLILFLVIVTRWGKCVYGKNNIFACYGLIFSSENFGLLLLGIISGFGATFGLFFTEYVLGWIEFRIPSLPVLQLSIEGFISAITVGLGEELFFRGFVLWELERDFSAPVSANLNALIFALSHFIKPPGEVLRTIVTFPALYILGMILVKVKRQHHNLLGMSIGLHSGLVWAYYIVNVGRIVVYKNQAPLWITGIDNNPIAGIMGISFLLLLGYLLTRR
ncbi:MAG: type II CAAX endopeptidase family protein [Geminocystis sp.]|nr:type II CAAX endopeptidase family protein [Geminocystis sp.]MDW8462326.1 type II CAAX endopeptidase family protein [Geminocystis sp.]